jgi:hypothetical protein
MIEAVPAALRKRRGVEEEMAKQFERIEPAHAAFIAGQRVFFTASAAATGRVNVSPRGTDAFRVLGPGFETGVAPDAPEVAGGTGETVASVPAA